MLKPSPVWVRIPPGAPVGAAVDDSCVYDDATRTEALRLLDTGAALSEVSRRTGVSRAALRDWRRGRAPRIAPHRCPRCSSTALDCAHYAALLGYYLGDGCVSESGRYYSLRVSCDASLPGIVDDVRACIKAVHPERPVFHVRAQGVEVLHSNWMHWPCLFPQHGPGRKHTRRIRLEAWQEDIVAEHGGALLRGLFHSDGSRVANWATRRVGNEVRRYDYPRWMFSNRSDDIIDICTAALDRLGIAWRRPRVDCIAVSRRADVARLDELIGLKS
jgi:hypothetical protein